MATSLFKKRKSDEERMHTYKIKFDKRRFNDTGISWEEVSTNELYILIVKFCNEYNITLKKLVIQTYDSYIKFRCTQSSKDAFLSFLFDSPVGKWITIVT